MDAEPGVTSDDARHMQALQELAGFEAGGRAGARHIVATLAAVAVAVATALLID